MSRAEAAALQHALLRGIAPAREGGGTHGRSAWLSLHTPGWGRACRQAFCKGGGAGAQRAPERRTLERAQPKCVCWRQTDAAS